jgi:hypothetical protein
VIPLFNFENELKLNAGFPPPKITILEWVCWAEINFKGEKTKIKENKRKYIFPDFLCPAISLLLKPSMEK